MTPGLLISFEGSEGCGKSTQIQRLKTRFQSQGRQVEIHREPGGTVVGESIRTLLQHSPDGHLLTPEAELLLFAASRAQLVREKLLPQLTAGSIVILDRFLDSTTVYQGIARGLPLASVEAINQFAVGSVLPHLTIVLDMPAEAAWERIERTGRELDRMENQPLTFFEKVRQGYLDLAARHATRMVVLNAALAPDEVERQIWTHIENRCHALQS